jgi:hypothetical protein
MRATYPLESSDPKRFEIQVVESFPPTCLVSLQHKVLCFLQYLHLPSRFV